jgi:hypothetical protein
MALFSRWKKNKPKSSSSEIELKVHEKEIKEGLFREIDEQQEQEDYTKKRRFLRYDVANSLWYSVADSEDQIKEVGIARQMALGGLGMHTFNPLEIGGKLNMEIVTDDDHSLKIASEVAYCNQLDDGTFDVGVEFTQINADDLIYLKKKFPPKPDV